MNRIKETYLPVEGDSIKEQGFTILEVLIAISLLAVGLLAVANLQITAIQGNSAARRTTEQTTWAQDKMEQLMALRYTHADLNAGVLHTEANPPANFIVTWTTTDNTPVTSTKLIAVTVAGLGKTTVLTGVKPDF